MLTVSILTRPEGRVQQAVLSAEVVSDGFQSSPVPRDGCNNLLDELVAAGLIVSILTRPEGRVQLL